MKSSISFVFLLVCIGCGGEQDAEPQGGMAGAGTAGLGGGGGTGGASGGSAGGGSAGLPVTPDCSGSFGELVELFSVQAPAEIHSPAIAPGNLELFYVFYPDDDIEMPPGNFMRSTRTSETVPFAPGAPVAELDAACQPTDRRTIDLSLDGLRAYVVCFVDDISVSSGELRIARREAPGAPFVLDAMTYGLVGASASIAPDELSVYSNSENGIGSGPLRRYVRATDSESFADGSDVSGLEMTLMSSPDIGPDDLALFAGMGGDIVRVLRPDASGAFGPPEVVVPVISSPEGIQANYGAPDASSDCSRLYAVSVTYSPEEGGTSYGIVEVRR